MPVGLAEGGPVVWYYNADHPVRRFFSGVTEHAFMQELGFGDPQLIDYLSLLLARFVSMDAIQKLKSGRPVEQVADLLQEAETMPPGRTSREVHRHIGDFTLFWTGVYPEALKRLQSILQKDHFIDYCEQGKRSYLIASKYEDDPYRDEAPVLRQLSEQFEMCAFGLNKVRQEWEKVNHVAG